MNYGGDQSKGNVSKICKWRFCVILNYLRNYIANIISKWARLLKSCAENLSTLRKIDKISRLFQAEIRKIF